MSQLYSWVTLRRLFKYGVPVVLLLATLLALADQFARSAQAREVLAPYSKQIAVLVGVGYQSRNGIEKRVKDYQLLPNATAPPRMLAITWTGDDAPIVDDSGANWFGFIFGIIIKLVVLVFVIRMWRRDLQAPSNTSLERTREG